MSVKLILRQTMLERLCMWRIGPIIADEVLKFVR